MNLKTQIACCLRNTMPNEITSMIIDYMLFQLTDFKIGSLQIKKFIHFESISDIMQCLKRISTKTLNERIIKWFWDGRRRFRLGKKILSHRCYYVIKNTTGAFFMIYCTPPKSDNDEEMEKYQLICH